MHGESVRPYQLLAGDVTKYGVVVSVQSTNRYNSFIRVVFADNAPDKVFKKLELVQLLKSEV